jgi:hypothetical protein
MKGSFALIDEKNKNKVPKEGDKKMLMAKT